MQPSWRQPSTTPIPVPRGRACDLCEGALPDGRLRCDACVAAARVAIAEANGGTVRESDILRVRERVG
jgi:hypothetical protein